MKSKAAFYLVVCFVFSLAEGQSAAAHQKPCTTTQEKHALDEADRMKDWDALHASFIRFAHCDDGAIAEGYSDTVGRLLAQDWQHIAAFVKIVASDKKFEAFVLRHIDETIPTDTLRMIANNAEKSCPVDATSLCKKILRSTQAAAAK
jgi:hypothetical protein